jgi:Secretion system C-terminal sorting domain
VPTGEHFEGLGNMKKLYTFLIFVGMSLVASSQMTAMDFNRNDCNGNAHHLFADLDAGNVVILEYIMLNCNPCIAAGHTLEAMKTDLLAQFPGKVKSYSFGFTNAYSCSSIASWVSSNGFTSVPMDSGNVAVSYYGGFGMPTVVILGGGSNHFVLGDADLDFMSSDTATMAGNIRNFLSQATAVAPAMNLIDAQLYPQPANQQVLLEMNLREAGILQITLLDFTGREIKLLYSGMTKMGTFHNTIETQALSNGVYLLRLQQGNQLLTKRLTVAH